LKGAAQYLKWQPPPKKKYDPKSMAQAEEKYFKNI